MKIMVISFKKPHACTAAFSVPDPKQATADPCLHCRLLDTHRQVWVSLLCGHRSFLLGSGVHKVLFVPSKCLFPQSCGSSIIKSHWPPKSNFLGVLSPFARSPGWKICCGSQNFLNSLWYNCLIVCGKKLRLCGSQPTVENLQQIGIPDHLTYLLRNLCKSRSNNQNWT